MSRCLERIWSQGLCKVIYLTVFSLSFLKVFLPKANLPFLPQTCKLFAVLAQVLESFGSLAGSHYFAMSGSAWSNVVFLIKDPNICVLQKEATSNGKRVQGSLMSTVWI